MSRPRKALRRFISCRTPGALRRLRAAGEEGFTLIELVITLVILPLIMGAVAFAIIVTLQDQAGTSTRLSDSVDSQTTSAYYGRDVESAQYVTTGLPGNLPWPSAAWTGASACGSGAQKDLILSMAWASGTKLVTGATNEAVVSYWRTQLATGTGITSADGKLHAPTGHFRQADVGLGVVQTNGTSGIPFGAKIVSVQSHSTAILSRAVASTTVDFSIEPQLVRDFCVGSPTISKTTVSQDFFTSFTHAVIACGNSAPTCASTAASSWISTNAIATITLSIAEPAGRYDYSLTAAPRLSNLAGNSLVANCSSRKCRGTVPNLLALGGSDHAITIHATSSITVSKGTAVINHGSFWMTNQSLFQVLKPTGSPATRGTGYFEATDTPCTPSFGAKCTGVIKPFPPQRTSPVADPLAALSDPPSATHRTCPQSSATLYPGQYRCPLTIGPGETVTLSRGIYEFDTGVRIHGNGGNAKLIGIHALIYLPCSSVNGVTIDSWATQCSEALTVTNGSLAMSPALTQQYGGIWFWQNRGDHQSLSTQGRKNSLTLSGVMYLPSGKVTLTGLGKVNTQVGSMVATTFSVSNSSVVVTGF